jgi:hypothetical protein
MTAFSPQAAPIFLAALGIDDDPEPEWIGPLPELSDAAWDAVRSGMFPAGRGSRAAMAELRAAKLVEKVREGMSERTQWSELARALKREVGQ